MGHTVTIRWSDDRLESAPSWEALEEKVRAYQWWPMTPDEFRAEMQKRALRWSGTEIATTGSSEEFFAELARARVVLIETTPEEETS